MLNKIKIYAYKSTFCIWFGFASHSPFKCINLNCSLFSLHHTLKFSVLSLSFNGRRWAQFLHQYFILILLKVGAGWENRNPVFDLEGQGTTTIPIPHFKFMVGVLGLEPRLCPNLELIQFIRLLFYHWNTRPHSNFVRLVGIEPTTCAFLKASSGCSL